MGAGGGQVYGDEDGAEEGLVQASFAGLSVLLMSSLKQLLRSVLKHFPPSVPGAHAPARKQYKHYVIRSAESMNRSQLLPSATASASTCILRQHRSAARPGVRSTSVELYIRAVGGSAGACTLRFCSSENFLTLLESGKRNRHTGLCFSWALALSLQLPFVAANTAPYEAPETRGVRHSTNAPRVFFSAVNSPCV